MGFLDTLFGKPKREDYQLPETIRPYQSISGFPVGKSLEQSLLSGFRGEGIGLPRGYTERATSPFIASREAGWSERELPFLEETYSGRGLGRSTQAAEGIGQAYAQKERDINEILANAYMQDIAQRKSDIQNLRQLGLGYSGQEVGTRGQAAQFDLNRALQQNELDRAYSGAETGALNRMIGVPLQIGLGVAGAATGNPMLAASGFGGAFNTMSGQDNSELQYSLINQALQASPFTFGGNTRTYENEPSFYNQRLIGSL